MISEKMALNQAFVDALRLCLGKDPLYKQLDEPGGFALHADWSLGEEMWDLKMPEDLRENGNGAEPRVRRPLDKQLQLPQRTRAFEAHGHPHPTVLPREERKPTAPIYLDFRGAAESRRRTELPADP